LKALVDVWKRFYGLCYRFQNFSSSDIVFDCSDIVSVSFNIVFGSFDIAIDSYKGFSLFLTSFKVHVVLTSFSEILRSSFGLLLLGSSGIVFDSCGINFRISDNVFCSFEKNPAVYATFLVVVTFSFLHRFRGYWKLFEFFYVLFGSFNILLWGFDVLFWYLINWKCESFLRVLAFSMSLFNHREKFFFRYYLSSVVCVCVCMSLRLQPHGST